MALVLKYLFALLRIKELIDLVDLNDYVLELVFNNYIVLTSHFRNSLLNSLFIQNRTWLDNVQILLCWTLNIFWLTKISLQSNTCYIGTLIALEQILDLFLVFLCQNTGTRYRKMGSSLDLIWTRLSSLFNKDPSNECINIRGGGVKICNICRN